MKKMCLQFKCNPLFFGQKLDVRGRDSHKHSHFTKVGKSQQRIKVLVRGESTTSSPQMVGKATSELMHREDATRDLISRSPGQHDLLLPRVRSPELPYPQGTRAAPALKTAANTGAPYSELHPVKCINSPSVLWNLLHPLNTLRFNARFGNINHILKTIRRCQMLT